MSSREMRRRIAVLSSSSKMLHSRSSSSSRCRRRRSGSGMRRTATRSSSRALQRMRQPRRSGCGSSTWSGTTAPSLICLEGSCRCGRGGVLCCACCAALHCAALLCCGIRGLLWRALHAKSFFAVAMFHVCGCRVLATRQCGRQSSLTGRIAESLTNAERALFLQSSVTCHKCGGRFTMYEPFWDLRRVIEQNRSLCCSLPPLCEGRIGTTSWGHPLGPHPWCICLLLQPATVARGLPCVHPPGPCPLGNKLLLPPPPLTAACRCRARAAAAASPGWASRARPRPSRTA